MGCDFLTSSLMEINLRGSPKHFYFCPYQCNEKQSLMAQEHPQFRVRSIFLSSHDSLIAYWTEFLTSQKFCRLVFLIFAALLFDNQGAGFLAQDFLKLSIVLENWGLCAILISSKIYRTLQKFFSSFEWCLVRFSLRSWRIHFLILAKVQGQIGHWTVALDLQKYEQKTRSVTLRKSNSHYNLSGILLSIFRGDPEMLVGYTDFSWAHTQWECLIPILLSMNLHSPQLIKPVVRTPAVVRLDWAVCWMNVYIIMVADPNSSRISIAAGFPRVLLTHSQVLDYGCEKKFRLALMCDLTMVWVLGAPMAKGLQTTFFDRLHMRSHMSACLCDIHVVSYTVV